MSRILTKVPDSALRRFRDDGTFWEGATRMDIHKPKAAHSVREFLIEIGTIICGILIALALEQGVEWLHWRHIVSEARESLDFDLRRGLGWAGAQDAEAPCVARRLQELSAALDEADRTGRLPAVAWFGNPRGASWVMRSWSTVVSSQSLPHMPVHDQQMLSAVETAHESMFRWRDEQTREWAVLMTMVGPGRQIQAAQVSRLRESVAQAWQLARIMRFGAERLASVVVQTKMLSRNAVESSFQQGVSDGISSSMCRRQTLAGTLNDALPQGLSDPPLKPGEFKLEDVGVRGSPPEGR